MFGLFGSAKWFMIVVTMPLGSQVGTMRAAEFKSERQCLLQAETYLNEAGAAYTCMTEKDYGLLLRYGQTLPLYSKERAR